MHDAEIVRPFARRQFDRDRIVLVTGATRYLSPSMNCCMRRAKPWRGKAYSIARTIGSPLFAHSAASSRMYGANSTCNFAMSRQIAQFSADSTRHGASENCIIGISACTWQERTKSFSSTE